MADFGRTFVSALFMEADFSLADLFHQRARKNFDFPGISSPHT
jgi:hypothetical protein